jgi:hypothetical protein
MRLGSIPTFLSTEVSSDPEMYSGEVLGEEAFCDC